MAKYIMKS